MAKHIKKAQSGTKQPTPTYKNLRLGVANKRRELGLPDRDGYGASSADSAFYRFGFGRGLRGEKGYPGEPELQKMGRWEGQNVGKKKPPSKKTGGTVKKAQNGDSTSWKKRTLPNLTSQGLDYEIGRLSKMTTPKSAPSVIQQKIDILKREKARRSGQNTTPTIKKQRTGGKVTKARGGKQMLKRADGSYSQRGLWDNIRAAKGSGKKPTAAMLKQERKIKAKSK